MQRIAGCEVVRAHDEADHGTGHLPADAAELVPDCIATNLRARPRTAGEVAERVSGLPVASG